MFTKVLILATLGTTVPAALPARAQMEQESHTVTVEVRPESGIAISQPALELVLGGGATTDQSVFRASDESTIIAWGTNRRHQKITVQTSLPDPAYTLRVRAVQASAGTPMPELVLSTTPRDFLRDIGRSYGYTLVRYTGEARVEQGSGSDQHVITFTLTAQ